MTRRRISREKLARISREIVDGMGVQGVIVTLLKADDTTGAYIFMPSVWDERTPAMLERLARLIRDDQAQGKQAQAAAQEREDPPA